MSKLKLFGAIFFILFQYVGQRSALSLKSAARTISQKVPSKWVKYLPDAPEYGKVNLHNFFTEAHKVNPPVPVKPEQMAEIMEEDYNERFTKDEGRKILMAMTRLNDDDLDLTKANFWNDVIKLSVSV